MHFQFLVEDMSGGALIDIVMEKLVQQHASTTYQVKPFRGIGGIPKRSPTGNVKTQKLLTDLPMYLRGFARSLTGIPAAIFVVLDNDARDTAEFSQQLHELVTKTQAAADTEICIAIEEMEAWLLGDRDALRKAYPHARNAVLQKYKQDSICGTWEVLADAVYKGGAEALKRQGTYVEIGRCKMEWARNIGVHMALDSNKSPSFQHFLQEIRRRITEL